MVEGETETDVYAMDVARFGDWATRPYTRQKSTENYQRRFSIGYPNEELPVGRPLETTPAYGIWDARRAVFGAAYGMEHVNYFAPADEPRHETPTFRRSNAFWPVAAECKAVREAVGLNEIHNFGKYIVSGSNAVDWLNRIMANRVPDLGRMALTPMLSPRGRIIGDFTMARIGEDRVQLTASYAAQNYHMRWFLEHREDGVEIENVSKTLIGFQIAGPHARDLLGRVTGMDVSNDAIRFLSVHEAEIGHIPVRIQRVSYTGDLGYEIYCAADHQVALYRALAAEGHELGMRPFGMRAMMSLRLEKFFGSWLREFKPDYTPAETGLDRFISWKKNDFIGRDVVMRERDAPPARQLTSFIVEADDADVVAWEPIFDGEDVIGFVTSGGYAHYSQKSVALGLIPRERVVEGAKFQIEILGSRRTAVIHTTYLVDADGARMRG
jgi:dimethylglycine dehydrogenase